ncbi:Bloom syndrome protein-like [Mizuhopecten yessoensis]|uniref:DNA 3'-5' helicase n=1 Tax=Mizuhopecten yessoensis TaxID=6573 RepID=A0A210QYU7_MIZYE|nr:Bloom syndrome protein-like [Mizuhopecten yessoensis]
MLNFPVTTVYCDSLESVGYSFQYVDAQLQAQQYIPMEDQGPENRIFAQYHKGYTDKMKNLIISELQKENPKLRLVFATVALGMGFNSPSACRIIHFRPPTTLERYLQAGRSGQEAHALVYYNNSDVASNRKGLKLEVKQYVKNTTSCLRKHLVSYFGFSEIMYNGPPEKCCSNCRNQSQINV